MGQYWVISNYKYNHKSRTQDAPVLRTGDGGLKIFADRSTLLTHPVPQTLMHNDYTVRTDS